MTRQECLMEIDAISARFAPMHEAIKVAAELNEKYPDTNTISREDYNRLAASGAAMDACIGNQSLWFPRCKMYWRGMPVEVAA